MLKSLWEDVKIFERVKNTINERKMKKLLKKVKKILKSWGEEMAPDAKEQLDIIKMEENICEEYLPCRLQIRHFLSAGYTSIHLCEA